MINRYFQWVYNSIDGNEVIHYIFELFAYYREISNRDTM